MAKIAKYNSNNSKYSRNGGSWQGSTGMSAGIAGDGNTYVTRLTFPGIVQTGIKSVKLYFFRTDSYREKTWKVTWSTSDGTSIVGTNLGTVTTTGKAWNSISLPGLISSTPRSTFYIRLMHGSGGNSYGELAGYGASNQPYLEVTYNNAVVKYYSGGWKDCEVYRYDGSKWVQVEVRYYNGSAWKEIGG